MSCVFQCFILPCSHTRASSAQPWAVFYVLQHFILPCSHIRASEQCPMCSDHLISLSPNPSASAHLWAMSCVLWHFILPYSYSPPHVTLLYCTWARAWSLIIYLIITIMSYTHLVFSEHLPLSLTFLINKHRTSSFNLSYLNKHKTSFSDFFYLNTQDLFLWPFLFK